MVSFNARLWFVGWSGLCGIYSRMSRLLHWILALPLECGT